MKKLIFSGFWKIPKKNLRFFSISKKSFFSELKKKVGYSFDVKNWDLSIADVFRAIRAILLPEKVIYPKNGLFFPLIDIIPLYLDPQFGESLV